MPPKSMHYVHVRYDTPQHGCQQCVQMMWDRAMAAKATANSAMNEYHHAMDWVTVERVDFHQSPDYR